MAQRFDDIIEQGATFHLSLIYADDDEQPIDLTGYSVRLQMRRTYDAADTLFSVESPNAMLVIGTQSGAIDLAISAETTATFPAGRWPYDLEIEDADGVVTRVIEGHLTVTPEVTRV